MAHCSITLTRLYFFLHKYDLGAEYPDSSLRFLQRSVERWKVAANGQNSFLVSPSELCIYISCTHSLQNLKIVDNLNLPKAALRPFAFFSADDTREHEGVWGWSELSTRVVTSSTRAISFWCSSARNLNVSTMRNNIKLLTLQWSGSIAKGFDFRRDLHEVTQHAIRLTG